MQLPMQCLRGLALTVAAHVALPEKTIHVLPWSAHAVMAYFVRWLRGRGSSASLAWPACRQHRPRSKGNAVCRAGSPQLGKAMPPPVTKLSALNSAEFHLELPGRWREVREVFVPCRLRWRRGGHRHPRQPIMIDRPTTSLIIASQPSEVVSGALKTKVRLANRRQGLQLLETIF
jgi:hypothetical protein